jgi:hypothetical protein
VANKEIGGEESNPYYSYAEQQMSIAYDHRCVAVDAGIILS